MVFTEDPLTSAFTVGTRLKARRVESRRPYKGQTLTRRHSPKGQSGQGCILAKIRQVLFQTNPE